MVLLNAGADAKKKDKEGRTAFLLAGDQRWSHADAYQQLKKASQQVRRGQMLHASQKA
jgi:hypothetical protein